MPNLPKVLAQAIRFALVSGVSFAIDVSAYMLLSTQLGLDSSWAKRISFACIAIWAYFAHKYFTFRDKSPNGNEPLKFGLLYLSGAIINSFVHDLSASQAEPSRTAFLVATFAWACWNFLGQKFFVFRNADSSGAQNQA